MLYPLPKPARLGAALRQYLIGASLMAALGPGCADPGQGLMSADRLEVTRCDAPGDARLFEPFSRQLNFLGLVSMDGTAFLRMSPLHQDAAEGDQLLLVVPSLDLVTQGLEGGGVVTREVGTAADEFSLSLALLDACAENHDPLMADTGTLTLRHLGTAPGARVEGELTVHLLNERTGEEASGELVAVFDFPVVTTTPHQPFSAVGEHRTP